MKNTLILFVILFSLFSCQDKAPKSYVTLSGTIKNKNSDKITIRNSENEQIKSIAISKDGTFSDTLIVKKGKFSMSDGNEYAFLFLRPGDEIKIELDADKFDETLNFSGNGSKESNYMVKKLLMQEAVFTNINDLYSLSSIDFKNSLEISKKKFFTFLKDNEGLDTDFIQLDIEDTDNLFGYLGSRYEKMSKINKLIGHASPTFNNYENHNGGTTSLNDLIGKPVYIDIWATWCKPCLGEIPALKELEKELGDKIHFVSISVDKVDKHQAWKDMVTEKELKGVQLYADSDWKSQFVQDYGVDGIPRFILLDAKGNVVKPDASRPSNPKTKEILLNLVQ